MSDKEMLELAAKAAGYFVRCVGDGVKGGPVEFFMEPSQLWWNPLTDDGDALRLAVNLHISSHWSHLGYATALQMPLRAAPTIRIDEYGSDPYATTRRAIVRAAAEIGKAMV